MALKLINLSAQLESKAVRNLIDQLEYPIERRDERTNQILSDYQHDPSTQLFGLKEAGTLLGLIGLLRKAPHAAVIRHIVVHRKHRGRGIGRTMIDSVCQEFAFERFGSGDGRRCCGLLHALRLHGSEFGRDSSRY